MKKMILTPTRKIMVPEEATCYGRFRPYHASTVEQFTVDDTELGIRAVSAALGFGMAGFRQYEECPTGFDKYGYLVNPNDLICFKSPVVFLHPRASAFRAVWGDAKATFSEQIVTYPYFPDQEQRLVDVYLLHTGMGDGGLLIQDECSRKCQTAIVAEKQGKIWTISFLCEEWIDRYYESLFEGANEWYHNRLERQSNSHDDDDVYDYDSYDVYRELGKAYRRDEDELWPETFELEE